MRDIEQYFDVIESVLTHSGAEDVEVTYTPLSRTSGMVNGALYLTTTVRQPQTSGSIIKRRMIGCSSTT
ncbi:TPA: hypothetical protein EYP66_12585 [Candidatus Poribacteria bacterium]|nr:hypothetical protein [Candidatus Poribacteria bacterium]